MESLELGPQPASPRRRLQIIVAAVVIVGLMIAVGIHNLVSGSSASAPAGSALPTPASHPTPAPSTTRPAPTPSGTPDTAPISDVEQWRTDGFLSDVDLDLFARSDLYMYRIQTKKKLVTATKTPSLQTSGAVTFVTDRDQVIVKDFGSQSLGYVVPDGKPPRPLPPALTGAYQIFAGPPRRLWVTTRRGEVSTTRLTDLHGKPVRAARGVTRFRNIDALMSDGFGGLLTASAGGYYELTPQGPRRLTRGSVLATGRTHLLTVDCNSSLKCSSYLLDRETGGQRRLTAVAADIDGNGTVSDDGRYAALWSWNDSGSQTLRVLDLHTNTTIGKVTDPDGYGDDYSSLLWLPDNRLLGIRGGKLFVFSPKTGQFATPKLRIDGLEQLSLRRT